MEEDLDLEEGRRLAAVKEFAYRHRYLLAVLAVAVVAGAAAGWGYARHQKAQQVEASSHYQDGVAALTEGLSGDARQAFKTLVTEYGGTTYATMGRVLRARLLHADGDPEGALALLEPVVGGQSGHSEARQVAVEEAARIHWEQGDVEGALASLEEIAGTAYQPSYFQLRGDLLAAADRPRQARSAYKRALKQPGAEALRSGLESRIDQLPGSGGAPDEGDGA
ncbi:YfgM family protein [Thiohalorhabdus sp.]|uniref:YfgM family protein n=1 Tax=Thiohalorhabdus sp. TaxID=3094134 RepID=UPI002FC35335